MVRFSLSVLVERDIAIRDLLLAVRLAEAGCIPAHDPPVSRFPRRLSRAGLEPHRAGPVDVDDLDVIVGTLDQHLRFLCGTTQTGEAAGGSGVTVALFGDQQIEGAMGKSAYEIRIVGTVPVDLLEHFHQIESVEPAGTILRTTQLDDAAVWGLIDALRDAGLELVEIRRDFDLPLTEG